MNKAKYIQGDWVKFKGAYYPILMVNHDRAEIFYHRKDNTNKWLSVRFGDLTPIPLTADILIKNGWKKVHQQPVNCCETYAKAGSITLSSNIYTKAICYETYERYTPIVVRLDHVHQLQHLLFGLNISMDLIV